MGDWCTITTKTKAESSSTAFIAVTGIPEALQFAPTVENESRLQVRTMSLDMKADEGSLQGLALRVNPILS